jgi:hypothetical protein
MSLRHILLVALALVLALAAVGCSSGAGSAEDSSATEPAETDDAGATSAEFRDLSYLTGTWTVTTELVEIDNPAMTAAADQPGATWECVVAGDTMTLVTDRHEYTDTLRPEAEGGWVYEASSTFTDEDGYTVTSTIAVSGKPTSTDLDAFVGGMTGTIDTPDGRLYTAQWDIEGRRQL